MLIHLIFIIISCLGFYLSNYLPVEITFFTGGLYFTYVFTKYKAENKWLLPPVLFSVAMFFYIYVGAIIIKTGLISYSRFSNDIFHFQNINKAIFLTLFSNSTMWIAFIFTMRVKIPHMLFQSDNKCSNYTLKKRASLIIFSTSVFIYIYGIQKGYIGFSMNEDNASSFTNLITLLNHSNYIILIIYFFRYFDQLHKRSVAFPFYGLTLTLVFLGLLSGSKFNIVLPLIYISLSYYYKKKILFNRLTGVMIVFFLLTFAIITPIRFILTAKKEGANIDKDLIFEVISDPSKNVLISEAITNAFYRITYVPQLILAINYSESTPPPAVKNLWIYTAQSPVNAFLPRVLYPNKPEITFGKWFSYYVYGSTKDNNIGATYQGILFMNGHLISVFWGFVLVGILQALFVRAFLNTKYLPIYLLFLLKLTLLPQEPWILYTSIIQTLIIVLILFNILTKKQ